MSRGCLRFLGFVAVLVTVACARSADPPLTPLAGLAPGTADVERVVFLVGDAGLSDENSNPVLLQVGNEVERWSAVLQRDSAVSVVYLGDNVYPDGVHAVGHPERGRDSLRLRNQIDVVAGPAARTHSTRAYFLAGNHDWGGDSGPEGLALLKNQEDLITDARTTEGIGVDLLPPAGDPGPEVVDLAHRLKMVAIDTQWWLFYPGTRRHATAVAQLRRAVSEPEDHTVLVVSHHPMISGGPHGGYIDFWPTVGGRLLLNRAGINGQDLSAVPYRQLIADLRSVFDDTEAMVLYASGHDHDMQVIRGGEIGDPDWQLVSGSGSKREAAGEVEGGRFRSAEFGFMRLFVLGDGGLLLEVSVEGVDGFETVYSDRLR